MLEEAKKFSFFIIVPYEFLKDKIGWPESLLQHWVNSGLADPNISAPDQAAENYDNYITICDAEYIKELFADEERSYVPDNKCRCFLAYGRGYKFPELFIKSVPIDKDLLIIDDEDDFGESLP